MKPNTVKPCTPGSGADAGDAGLPADIHLKCECPLDQNALTLILKPGTTRGGADARDAGPFSAVNT